MNGLKNYRASEAYFYDHWHGCIDGRCPPKPLAKKGSPKDGKNHFVAIFRDGSALAWESIGGFHGIRTIGEANWLESSLRQEGELDIANLLQGLMQVLRKTPTTLARRR